MAEKKLVTLDLLQRYHNSLVNGAIKELQNKNDQLAAGTGIAAGSITLAQLSSSVQASLAKADASASNSALLAEVTRAKEAEKTNTDAIAVINGTGEGSIKYAVEAEKNRALAAEGANTTAIARLQAVSGLSVLAEGAKSLNDRLAVLEGDSLTQGSVAYQIAKIVNENNNGSIDTLNELAAWITNDTTGAAKLKADILALQTALGTNTGTKTVVSRVSTLEDKLNFILKEESVTMADTNDIDAIFAPVQQPNE